MFQFLGFLLLILLGVVLIGFVILLNVVQLPVNKRNTNTFQCTHKRSAISLILRWHNVNDHRKW